LFCKDRITTFELRARCYRRPAHSPRNQKSLLSADPEAWFYDKVLSEFGVDPSQGMIVNGHVPVKVEKGESPLRLDSFSICCSATRFSA
jgi:fructose-1,6-bisphosphatase III